MSGYRLKSASKEAKQVRFHFEGQSFLGIEGDTLASALIANGVSVVARSFKYHRPRGLLASGYDEPNAIVQIGDGANAIPNLKATTVELYEGLNAEPVNAWPSLRFDLLSVNSMLKRVLPAGFYYKTFMWPDWHLFEPTIRRAAGLGISPSEPDCDTYDKKFREVDLLVVGSGVTGLKAAKAAAALGAEVLLVEADATFGGRMIHGTDRESHNEILSILEELKENPKVTLMSRTMAFGYYDHNLVALCERLTDHLPEKVRRGPRQRMWKVRAKKVIIATGAIERPLVFPSNDRPGIMLASAAEIYATKHKVAVGKSIVLFTNNSSAYKSALTLHKEGINVHTVVDARTEIPAKDLELAQAIGAKCLASSVVIDVQGTRRVKGVSVSEINAEGQAQKNALRKIACDTVLMSGGWSPAVHLFSQSGGKLRFDETVCAFVPDKSVQSCVCVGGAAGEFDLTTASENAKLLGSEAIKDGEVWAHTIATHKACSPTEIRPLWVVETKGVVPKGRKAWLDYQNDVTASDVKLAMSENFQSVEHVKRYTTLGMASDQGKTSNVNAIGIMERQLSKPIPEIGTTKFRPPYDPTTIGVFAGRDVGKNLVPAKRIPSHERSNALGGAFEDYGGWERPAFYSEHTMTEREAIAHEVLAARQNVALFDASPLGKIEVKGPDASEFLNRIYVNNIATLKPMACRYGLMLDENGIVYDDGVVAKLSDDHFLVGTTSGHAGAIAQSLVEWLRCEWTDLCVAVADVTTSWATINIFGPNARMLVEQFSTDIDFSADAFPHMRFRSGTFDGLPCRVQRVSFSGELSYELSIPWATGAELFDKFLIKGRDLGVTPIGLEALMVMRIEKGFLHVGSDTDGMTIPQDIGFAKIIDKKKSDFIGRRSIMREDAVRENRRQLVGIELLDDREAPEPGAHLIGKGLGNTAQSQGWVTSSVFSPTLNKPIAMGLVENGYARLGEDIDIFDLGEIRPAKIVEAGWYDPEGECLRG